MGGNQGNILTRVDLYKLLQSILGKLYNWRIHSEISTSFTRISWTCSHKLTNGCTLTTAVWSWLQTSQNKARENQTRFGMVSERLSTHPSGKKTSAAHFKPIPTRRLVVQFKLLTYQCILFCFTFRKSLLFAKTREAIASKKCLRLEHSSWTKDI